MPLENFNFCSLHWNTTGGGGGGGGGGLWLLYFEFTTVQSILVLLLTHVITSASLCACLCYEHHHIFVYLGLQVKFNQFSSNNSHHTSCIHKGSHAGKWPDLMTSKPDSASTLGYHWTDHTGRPLEPQVHWDATGTTLADASTQWCPSGDPVLICIIGTHWKTNGKPLDDHWKRTGNTLATKNYFPVAFPCTLGSKFQAHWIATGLPLEDHWLRVRAISFICIKIAFWFKIFHILFLGTHMIINRHWFR